METILLVALFVVVFELGSYWSDCRKTDKLIADVRKIMEEQEK